MTVPVSTERQILDGGRQLARTMCFYLGMAHQLNPPTPTDTHVFIQKRPGYKVYTR